MIFDKGMVPIEYLRVLKKPQSGEATEAVVKGEENS